MKFEKDINLIIPNLIIDKMIQCVNNAHPNEACGLLFGEKQEIIKKEENDYYYKYIGKRFICIKSDEESTIGFLIKNEEKLNKIFIKSYNELNMKLISIFHSHPSGNHPSRTDFKNMRRLDRSNLKSFKYSIWSIMDGTDKSINGFMYYNDELVQITIKVLN